MNNFPNIQGSWIVEIDLFRMKKLPNKPDFQDVQYYTFTLNLTQNYNFVYANIIGSNFRPEDGYLPGIIVKENNNWKLILTDYDDNGVFNININSDTNANGYYHEAGFGVKNLNQVPTVGNFYAMKVSNEITEKIPKNITDFTHFHDILRKNSLKNNNTNSKSILYKKWVYPIEYLEEEEIKNNQLGYDIVFTGPIFDVGLNNIIGYLFSVNNYRVINGNNECKVVINYYFYHEDNIIKFSNLPKSEKASYKGYTNFYDSDNFIQLEGSYQGNLTNAKFLLGGIKPKVNKKGGILSNIKNEEFEPKIDGSPDGIRNVVMLP